MTDQEFEVEFVERNRSHRIRWWRAKLLDALAGAAEQRRGLVEELFDELLSEVNDRPDVDPDYVTDYVVEYLQDNHWMRKEKTHA